MKTFVKDVEKMTERELRIELMVTRRIIDDIYVLINRPLPKTLLGRGSLINQIAHYCRREMPR